MISAGFKAIQRRLPFLIYVPESTLPSISVSHILSTMIMSHQQTDDPLDEFLRPPPDETPTERDLRLAREEEANRISLAIDATIKAEKQARKKRRIVRLLLLGQSESGECTTTCALLQN